MFLVISLDESKPATYYHYFYLFSDVYSLARLDFRMEQLDQAIEGGVHRFVHSFGERLPRARQTHWLGCYLWGLLESSGRRNVNSIARELPKNVIPDGSAPAQALQHLLNKSEWDEGALLRELRSRIPWFGEPKSSWIIHDVVFLKRGKHSVGVQRQFFRGLGQKANCQSAVMISQTGPSGYLPLELRLYLPRAWLEEAGATQLAAIPPEFRESIGRQAIAMQLLGSLASELGSRTPKVVASGGYAPLREVADFVASLGLASAADEESVRAAENGCEWLKDHLGLNHFEGRSWRGWRRHAAAVILAYGYAALYEPERLKRH